MERSVASCPPCRVSVEVKTAAGLPARLPATHSALVPSRKNFTGAAMLPKRVGLPRMRPEHSVKSSWVAKGGPSFGTAGSSRSMVAATGAIVRNRACMPATASTPRHTWRASAAVLPWRE